MIYSLLLGAWQKRVGPQWMSIQQTPNPQLLKVANMLALSMPGVVGDINACAFIRTTFLRI